MGGGMSKGGKPPPQYRPPRIDRKTFTETGQHRPSRANRNTSTDTALSRSSESTRAASIDLGLDFVGDSLHGWDLPNNKSDDSFDRRVIRLRAGAGCSPQNRLLDEERLNQQQPPSPQYEDVPSRYSPVFNGHPGTPELIRPHEHWLRRVHRLSRERMGLPGSSPDSSPCSSPSPSFVKRRIRSSGEGSSRGNLQARCPSPLVVRPVAVLASEATIPHLDVPPPCAR